MKRIDKQLRENEAIFANLAYRGAFFNLNNEMEYATKLKKIYGYDFLVNLSIESWKPNSLSYYFHEAGQSFLEAEQQKFRFVPEKRVNFKLNSKKIGKDLPIPQKRTIYDFIKYGEKN